MIRKQEIVNAAREYIDTVMFSLPSDVIYFEAGAEWADEHPNLESLWHDASEEPLLEDKEIIFLDELNFVFFCRKFDSTFSYMLEDLSWEEYMKFLRIIKWAYLDDLLPKQFGNSKQLKGGEQ